MNIDEFIKWLNDNAIGTLMMSRDKEEILACEEIRLSGEGLNDISRQISFRKSLYLLDLSRNNIRELPKEIVNLVDLKKLNLDHNPLTLNPNQVLWIEKLKKNGCQVILPDTPPNASFTRIFAVDYVLEPQPLTVNKKEVEISSEQYQILSALKTKMIAEDLSGIDVKSIIEKKLIEQHNPGYSITLCRAKDDIYLQIETSDGDCVRGSMEVSMEELDNFFESK